MMNSEQKNSLLGYVTKNLKANCARKNPIVRNLIQQFYKITSQLNKNVVSVEEFVGISVQIIDRFKQIPEANKLIIEYKQKLNQNDRKC